MVQHIYVNLTHAPVTVSLPSGASFEVGVGEAVRGAHFLRTAQAGILVPIEGCPKSRLPTVIHTPPGVSPTPKPKAAPAKAAPAGAVPTLASSGGAEFKGKTREGWIEWLEGCSDSTVMQTRLADLQGLAEFLGAEDIGSSKGDALQAIRSALVDE